MVLLEKRTYKGGVLFYLVENIKELFLEIKETKNETYSTSWPFLGCLMLVHWATGPLWMFSESQTQTEGKAEHGLGNERKPELSSQLLPFWPKGPAVSSLSSTQGTRIK